MSSTLPLASIHDASATALLAECPRVAAIITCTLSTCCAYRKYVTRRGVYVCTCSTHNTCTVPSAASFYVPTLPDLHQDPNRPLRIYAGHLPADPNAASAPATTLTAHLYFVLIKARKLADKERVLFWFNVRLISSTLVTLRAEAYLRLGWTWVLVL